MEKLFRLANRNDIPQIAKLHAESWQQTYKGIYSEAFLEKDVFENRKSVWEQRFLYPENQVVIIIEDMEELIGFICIYPNFDEKYGSLIDNLHIKSKYHGNGFGKILMCKAEEWILKNTKSSRRFLWVYEKNNNAIEFYEKLGGHSFEIESLESPDGQFHNAIRMIWDFNIEN